MNYSHIHIYEINQNNNWSNHIYTEYSPQKRMQDRREEDEIRERYFEWKHKAIVQVEENLSLLRKDMYMGFIWTGCNDEMIKKRLTTTILVSVEEYLRNLENEIILSLFLSFRSNWWKNNKKGIDIFFFIIFSELFVISNFYGVNLNDANMNCFKITLSF